jgi:hypothetical protein
MRRTMFMLVFVGTTLALAAGVALAQDSRGAETSRGEVGFTLEAFDCAGEAIDVTGKLNSVFHIVEDEDGFFHANTHFNFANVKGIGQDTGVVYRIPTVINSTQNVTSGEYPITITSEVVLSLTVSQGQEAPDFQSTAVIHSVIHEDGTVTGEVTEFRFVCRS